jgi:hypothetical protein
MDVVYGGCVMQDAGSYARGHDVNVLIVQHGNFRN